MRISREKLLTFTANVMKVMGCSDEKANVVAEVLVEADMRGVSSHGVARLRRYVNHIRDGIIDPHGEPKVIYETPISIVIDGNNGVGQYISKFSMERVIEKAKKTGVGLAAVRNSNHFGIAGYYAEMAVKEGLVGVSVTNTAPLVVHTYSKEPLLGTNPIAFAFPTNGKYPVLVDMATSVVPRGKLEVYSRLNKKIPEGWAVDETGHVSTDPTKILLNMKQRKGGLLPLGGEGEKYGGHKGYGLALIVEILSSGLSLGAFSYDTYIGKGKITHFFAAINLEVFGNPEEIKNHIQNLLIRLKNAERAEGAERIYIHGEKEYEKRERAFDDGVEIDEPTYKQLKELSSELGILL